MGLPFKILGVDHCGLAAKDPGQTRSFFNDTLKLPFLTEELVQEQKTNTIIFASQHAHNDQSTRLEILQDAGNGPIAKFLEKRGSGVHHIALRVDNIQAAFDYIKSQGIRMIDAQPRTGAHHTRIFFVHPESTGGILIEFVQNL